MKIVTRNNDSTCAGSKVSATSLAALPPATTAAEWRRHNAADGRKGLRARARLRQPDNPMN
jgi:hypothetical protein